MKLRSIIHKNKTQSNIGRRLNLKSKIFTLKSLVLQPELINAIQMPIRRIKELKKRLMNWIKKFTIVLINSNNMKSEQHKGTYYTKPI